MGFPTLIDTMMSLNLCVGITLIGITAPMNVQSCANGKVRKLVTGVQIIGPLLISMAMSHILWRIRSRKCEESDDSPAIIQVVSIGTTFVLSIILIVLGSLIFRENSGCDRVEKLAPAIIVIGVVSCLTSMLAGFYKIIITNRAPSISGGG